MFLFYLVNVKLQKYIYGDPWFSENLFLLVLNFGQRKFKDKLVNNYENYKLLFVCLAHYGKNQSKLEDKTIDENEADEHYDLNEEQNEQCLINVSPDATINVGDDSRKQILTN